VQVRLPQLRLLAEAREQPRVRLGAHERRLRVPQRRRQPRRTRLVAQRHQRKHQLRRRQLALPPALEQRRR
jgi:hypothetical protein